MRFPQPTYISHSIPRKYCTYPKARSNTKHIPKALTLKARLTRATGFRRALVGALATLLKRADLESLPLRSRQFLVEEDQRLQPLMPIA